MILPIVAFGHKVLRAKCAPIEQGFQNLNGLIDDMWSTMYNAHGVGLAAPQIGKPIRLFLIDTVQTMDEGNEDKGIKQAFINAQILEYSEDQSSYEEGCLSIPQIKEDVIRPDRIIMEYHDINFEKHIREFDGINARVIQHEYDHIEGILFIDKIKPLKKKMIKRKLDKVKTGAITSDYRMIYNHRL